MGAVGRWHILHAREAPCEQHAVQVTPPPPPCERNTKVPKFDGNNTPWALIRALFYARREKTQDTSRGQEGLKVGGRTETNIPKNTILICLIPWFPNLRKQHLLCSRKGAGGGGVVAPTLRRPQGT